MSEASPAPYLPDLNQYLYLAALQHQAHIYAGTVDPQVVAERRRRNRVARRSRRVNRARRS